MLFRSFSLYFCKITYRYIICNPVLEINKLKSPPKTAVSHNVNSTFVQVFNNTFGLN